jgi:aldose 1-epimerase
MSAESMPVAIGFHPYFQLTDSTRDDWTISVGARTHWRLAPNKVPTGERNRSALFPTPAAALRASRRCVRRSRARCAGPGHVTVAGRSQRLDVVVGPNYRAMVIYAPMPAAGGPDRQFICFEPMAGITDARPRAG